MKRKIAIMTIICGLVGGVLYGSASCAAYENTAVTITVDGETIAEDGKIVDGTTMVSFKEIATALGMNVNYESNKKIAYATDGKTVLTVNVNENTILKNGEVISISAKPQLISNTLYVPLRETVEVVGASVVWDAAAKSISVQSDDDSESDDSWKNNTGTIDLNTMTASGDGIEISGNIVKIIKAGDFEVKGTLSDGMIQVNCDGKVKLRLSGVNITNNNGPAIFAEKSKKLLITLTEGTQNILSDSSEYSEEYDAKGTLFSNDDIEIKGEGTLTVNAKYNHAIASDDDIKIENGNITVTSESGDGIHANDGIKLKGGNITVNAKGDGIQSEGYIEVYDGNINITTNGEVTASKEEFGGRNAFGGMMPNTDDKNRLNDNSEQNGGVNNSNVSEMPQGQGERGDRMMKNGFGGKMQNFEMPQGGFGDGMRNFETPQGGFGDGMQNFETPQGGFGDGMQNSEMPQGGFGNGMQNSENSADVSSEEDDSVSSKGLKADGALTVFGGNITINSTDTALKGDYVAVEGGTLDLTSSVKKGIKAMGDLFINGGEVSVKSYDEGIESKQVITINGGDVDVTANEDGMNAGGNTGMGVGRSTDESNTQHSIVINGGSVKVDSKNDGLDSNGSLVINGGTVIVNGPTSGGDSAFDTDGNFVINGGYVLGAGSVGMVESPKDTSAQNVLNIAFDSAHSANSEVSVKDSDGNTIFTFTPAKQYQSIIFSSDKVVSGKTYTATSESETISAEVTGTITAIGNVKSGFGGGRGGMRQGITEQNGETQNNFGEKMQNGDTQNNFENRGNMQNGFSGRGGNFGR